MSQFIVAAADCRPTKASLEYGTQSSLMDAMVGALHGTRLSALPPVLAVLGQPPGILRLLRQSLTVARGGSDRRRRHRGGGRGRRPERRSFRDRRLPAAARARRRRD